MNRLYFFDSKRRLAHNPRGTCVNPLHRRTPHQLTPPHILENVGGWWNSILRHSESIGEFADVGESCMEKTWWYNMDCS